MRLKTFSDTRSEKFEQASDILIERFDLRQVPHTGNLYELGVLDGAGSFSAKHGGVTQLRTNVLRGPFAQRGAIPLPDDQERFPSTPPTSCGAFASELSLESMPT